MNNKIPEWNRRILKPAQIMGQTFSGIDSNQNTFEVRKRDAARRTHMCYSNPVSCF